MKRFVFAFVAAILLFINCLPTSLIFADSGYSDSQLANIGTLMLTNLIASGEATELDFSDYTENEGFDFLISLGELAVTGDPTGLIDQGLTWLGGELSDAYDSLIESIREWEFQVAPDLYNWWYQGTDYEYKLVPAQNLSRPLRNLLKSPVDTPNPQPDPDFSFISNINNLYQKDGINLMADSFELYDGSSLWVFGTGSIKNTTICSDDYVYYGSHTGGISGRTPKTFSLTDICTINVITNQDNTISVIYTNSTILQRYIYQFSTPNNYANAVTIQEKKNNNNAIEINPFGYSTTYFPQSPYIRNSFDSLSTCINYIYQHYCNVNLYVDGIPWALASSPTYPIVIDDLLTVLNDQPAQYSFSEPTFIDLTGLTTLITNAINSSDIVTWQDIDDYFVDINGVQALPTIDIIRNDYDNMYLEQYPYPATLIGFNDPLKFNEHMLDNVSGQYLTPMVNVAQYTVNVLPTELKWVLGIGAILSIFALIINRLLE